MTLTTNPEPIRIGFLTDEPIRLEGFNSAFDRPTPEGCPSLLPVTGTLAELLAGPDLEYMVVDLHPTPGGLGLLEAIRRVRPKLRLIVIGPPAEDALIMDSIVAGARAYLDSSAGPEVVRNAIEAVIGGSIWAPRKLLSKLIERLLTATDSSPVNPRPPLTDRERQVLDLLLTARSNREIASQLGIEERTVKAHVGRLMRKAGAENRTELSMLALSHPPGPGAGFADLRANVKRPSEVSVERDHQAH